MQLKKVYPQYFIMPAVVLYTILFMVPSFLGLLYSFTDWNAYNDHINFIGFDNFKDIFNTDESYLRFIWNTFYFAGITTLLKVVLGLSLALLLNQSLKTTNILRTLFYLPVTLSPLVIGLVFISIFDPKVGVLNDFLRLIGLNFLTRSWLTDINMAMNAVMSVEIWRMAGYCMIIFLAGLQTIPKDYYEAAEVDGAGRFSKFFNVTLPFLQPAIIINVVLNLIFGLKVFELIFVLTKGGPGDLTGVLNTQVFSEFSSGRYGLATALNVIIMVLTLIVSLIVLRALSIKGGDHQ
ncbi:MAG: sugar ABC transporter permease [Gorillibacterium sp.]|nr:sugar ABC transporter permease [Gorillibacterium sp.]